MTDDLAVPEFWVHRFEQIIAVRWPGWERWMWVWPSEVSGRATVEWRDLGLDHFRDPDCRDQWVELAVGAHPDPGRWTGPIRRDLAAIQRYLEAMESHPWR